MDPEDENGMVCWFGERAPRTEIAARVGLACKAKMFLPIDGSPIRCDELVEFRAKRALLAVLGLGVVVAAVTRLLGWWGQ